MTALAACLAFVVIGVLGAAYGPLIPLFQARFGVAPAEAALVISAHAAGSIVGIIAAVPVMRRLTHRSFFIAALSALALGCLLFAVAPVWAAVIASAAIVGLGFGMLDLGLNQLFAHGFGSRSGAMLNVINGAYGVGAVAGPLLVASIAEPTTVIYLGAAVAAVVLLLPLSRVPGREPHGQSEADQEEIALRGIVGSTLVRVVGLFALAYLLYVGVEESIGGWEPTHLAAVGLSAREAAGGTSLFWLSLTVSRFLAVPIALRVSAQRIVLVCVCAAVVTLGLASVPGLAPFAYAATGLAMGPIWPMGIAWLAHETAPRRAPSAYLFGAGMFGFFLFPPLVGVVIQTFGVAATPVVLALLAAGTAAVFGSVALVLRARRSVGFVDPAANR
jgi:MFS transporter, FHS family, glucose/mannose:H+ symporter